jgi:hypothetical protein
MDIADVSRTLADPSEARRAWADAKDLQLASFFVGGAGLAATALGGYLLLWRRDQGPSSVTTRAASGVRISPLVGAGACGLLLKETF